MTDPANGDRRAPLLLAVEASSSVASVAVGRDGVALARAFLTERGRHAARMVPALDETLAAAGVERGELEGVVVGAGPGSFTGVRIAAATAKGIAFALGIPLRPLSSLAGAAVAEQTATERIPGLEGTPWGGEGEAPPDAGSGETARGLRYVLFDARGTRLYAACYDVSGESLRTVASPEATTLETLLSGPIPDGAVFVGDGAHRHATPIRDAGHRILPPPAGVPTAEGLLRLTAMDHDLPRDDDASRWQPEYLKGSSARPAGSG